MTAIEFDKIPVEIPLNFSKALLKCAFSQKHRHQLAMISLPSELVGVYRLSFLTPNKKLLYYKNSKAACTSVLSMLVFYSSGKYSDNPHKNPIGLIDGRYYLRAIHNAHRSPDTFKFSTVRHPETRILSTYKNFFVDKKNPAGRQHFSHISKRGFDFDAPSEKNFDIFLDYVEEAILQDRRYCDAHWREQHINMGWASLKYDKICKVENLEQDLADVFDAVDELDFIENVYVSERRNVSSDKAVSITKTRRSRIENIYAKDYEVFGY